MILSAMILSDFRGFDASVLGQVQAAGGSSLFSVEWRFPSPEGERE
jgi:hypothetical protein